MGATTPTLVLISLDGKRTYSYSLYFAGGDAAGYRVPVSAYLAAASTSPVEFQVPEPVMIKYLTGPATGVLRVLSNGQATPLLLNTAAVIAKASDANVTWGQLNGGNNRYSLVVEVAMAA